MASELRAPQSQGLQEEHLEKLLRYRRHVGEVLALR